jgi:hypothetical protein
MPRPALRFLFCTLAFARGVALALHLAVPPFLGEHPLVLADPDQQTLPPEPGNRPPYRRHQTRAA